MKSTIKLSLLFLFSLILILSMLGCNGPKQIGNTYEEPEITLEYLSTDYPNQLIKDGAILYFGTIEIVTDENSNPFVNITEKELVMDPGSPKGYYIADKNLEVTYLLSYEARTTHLAGQTSIATIMTSENFVKAVTSEETSTIQKTSEQSADKFYDIYVMGDQIELILAHYLN